ncbi:MAG: hypothetical protein R2912_09235 [Eubacteriales bacterium]
MSMAYPELLGRPPLLRALDELEEITRGLHVKLQYSHAIFVGRVRSRMQTSSFPISSGASNGVDRDL